MPRKYLVGAIDACKVGNYRPMESFLKKHRPSAGFLVENGADAEKLIGLGLTAGMLREIDPGHFTQDFLEELGFERMQASCACR